MKKVFYFLASFVKYILITIGAVVILFNTLLGVGQRNNFYPYVSTEFKKDFDKQIYWKEIKEGQTKEEVVTLLGEPLSFDTLSSNYCDNIKYRHYFRMSYSKEYYNEYLSFAWCAFDIYLDENFKVVNKEEHWWYD